MLGRAARRDCAAAPVARLFGSIDRIISDDARKTIPSIFCRARPGPAGSTGVQAAFGRRTENRLDVHPSSTRANDRTAKNNGRLAGRSTAVGWLAGTATTDSTTIITSHVSRYLTPARTDSIAMPHA